MESELKKEQIQEGKLLLGAWDKAGCEIRAAFWLYEKPISAWKLVIASSSKNLDAASLVKFIRSVPGIVHVSSRDVVMVPLDHLLLKNVAPMFRTGPGIADMKVTNTRMNNVHIEGMHLYRMNIS